MPIFMKAFTTAMQRSGSAGSFLAACRFPLCAVLRHPTGI
jgi:hypothetical protein